MELNNILKYNLLKEGGENRKKSAGILMLNFDKKIKNWKDVLKIIEPDDLYDNESEEFGFESDPHITILYGFNAEVEGHHVKTLFENINQYVKVKLTGIEIFEGKPDQAYDVVKFTIESDDLKQLHEKCKELPHTLTFPDYKPHMTIAYVKKGRGKRYIKEFTNPIYMEGNTFIYCSAEDTKTEWKIKKKYRYEININEHLRLIELFQSDLNEYVGNNQTPTIVRNMITFNNAWEDPQNPESFKQSLSKSKHKEMLTDYSVQDLSKMKLFKLKGYNIGYALKQFENEGYCEIVAVHNNEPDVKGIGDILMKSAIANGGKYLDHFDGFLSNLYGNLGFQEYKRDKYDPQYDPQGTFANTYGKQDVIYRKFVN